MKKVNIAIFFGGQSNEYPVSLMSSYNVLCGIDHGKYRVYMIGITIHNEWYLYEGDLDAILNDTWHTKKDVLQPISLDMSNKSIVAGDKKICVQAAMIVMHGKFGEDGSLQGVLNMLDIRIIGCNLMTSAIGLNKQMSHLVAESVNVNVAKSVVLSSSMRQNEYLKVLECMSYPLYIKPMNGGSSIGLSRIIAVSELEMALKCAFKEDDLVMVEQEIVGFEVGCAIIGKDNPVVSRVDEVDLGGCIFDYEQKYTQTIAKIITPARISQELENEIQDCALKLYKAFGCQGFARIDMFITSDHKIYFNEINTIPGMTKQSRFSKMFNAMGVSFEEMLDTIIEASIT